MVDFGWTVDVVRVVGDVRPLDPRDSPAAEVYWPARQHPRFATYFLIRTDSEPALSAPGRRLQKKPG